MEMGTSYKEECEILQALIIYRRAIISVVVHFVCAWDFKG